MCQIRCITDDSEKPETDFGEPVPEATGFSTPYLSYFSAPDRPYSSASDLCTPEGNRHLPGFPLKELDDLKRVMFSQHPQFWRAPVECVEPIQQASKRLRLHK